jgi:hypothetical protein
MLSKVGIWLGANVDRVSLILTVAVAITILVFSHLGLIDLSRHSDESIISLLCLVAICLFLVGGDSKRSATALDTKVAALQADLDRKFAKVCGDLEVQVGERHDLLLSKVIESVAGFEYRRFRDSTEFLNYLADRISQARFSVWDLTWVVDLPAERGAQAVAAEQKYHDAIIEGSKRIIYREVYIFCDEPKYQKLKKIIHENPEYYNCRYYQESKVPRPVFMIIDREEVLLYGIVDGGIYCSVQHPRLVESFTNFYQLVWAGATKLKEGTTIYTDEYDKVMRGH